MSKKQSTKPANKPDEDGFTFMRKLTTKAILGVEVSKFVAEYEDGSVDLFKIAGVVDRMRKARSQFGESVAFHGDFRVLTNDGRKIKSNQYFAPYDLMDMIMSQFANRPDGQDGVEFSAQISVIVDPTAKPLGYTYQSTPIIKVGTSQRLTALMEKTFGPKALK